MTQEWYFKTMGETFGPLSAEELRQHVQRGKIVKDTLVRRGSTGNWITADKMRGLIREGHGTEASSSSGDSRTFHNASSIEFTKRAPVTSRRDESTVSGRFRSAGVITAVLAGASILLGVELLRTRSALRTQRQAFDQQYELLLSVQNERDQLTAEQEQFRGALAEAAEQTGADHRDLLAKVESEKRALEEQREAVERERQLLHAENARRAELLAKAEERDELDRQREQQVLAAQVRSEFAARRTASERAHVSITEYIIGTRPDEQGTIRHALLILQRINSDHNSGKPPRIPAEAHSVLRECANLIRIGGALIPSGSKYTLAESWEAAILKTGRPE